MRGWICPTCDRLFERARQSHECAPGLTLDEYFSTGPAHERPVFDVVMAHLATVGPVHTDIVSVGVFLKNPHKFAELRPMQNWVALSFALGRNARHPTIARKVTEYNSRFWHTANLAVPEDFDRALKDLLTEAYTSSLKAGSREVVHAEHRALLRSLEEYALVGAPAPSGNDSYTSSGRPYLRVPVPQRRLVARAWLTQHRALAPGEVVAVVDSLFAGTTHEEKTLAAILLAAHPAARAAVTPGEIAEWLDQLHGWAEIDALCHNVFTANDLVDRWDAWTVLLTANARASDPDRNRAALVFLVGPVQHSGDERISALAFSTIDELKAERDPSITKALSWLLRALTTNHPNEVVVYLTSHQASLPALAVRETRSKLRTGTKSGRGRSTRQ